MVTRGVWNAAQNKYIMNVTVAVDLAILESSGHGHGNGIFIWSPVVYGVPHAQRLTFVLVVGYQVKSVQRRSAG